MAERFDVAVAGAGAAGLLFAVALQKRSAGRISIALIDAAPEPNAPSASIDTLRVSALSPGTYALLNEVGAWPDELNALAQVYTEMQVWDASSAPADAINFSAAESSVPALGYIAENGRVRHVLWQLARESGIKVYWRNPARALNLGADSAEIETDRAVIECSLVVAADGGRSRLREWAGIDVLQRDFMQSALVVHVNSEEPHRNTAWQRFTPDGPIALLPLADSRSSVVYSVGHALFNELRALDVAELGNRLTEAADGALGQLTVASDHAGFPLAALSVEQSWRRRLVLIGDAAHQIHPLAGQGANLGFADAGELASTLAAAPAGSDFGDEHLLLRYERARRPEVRRMQTALEALHRLFLHPSGVARQLRAGGLQTLNKSARAKRELARRAMGIV